MKNPNHSRICGLLFTVFLSMSALAGEKAGKHPNIVYLFADQLRACSTGYGGDPNVRTPNLDSLSQESVNFRNAVSVCPVCTPHRAALLTGRFPTTTGMFVNDAHLPERELCIAEVLKAAGYNTGYIGKWHLDGEGRLAYIPPERRQGFDYWKVAECDHNYNKSVYYADGSAEKKFWDGYDAFAQTKDAQQYIRDHSKDAKPFVLFVSYGIPHFPHGTAPEEFKAMFPPEKIKFRPNVPADLQTKQVRIEAQGYNAHIAALDKCIGEVMKTITDAGIKDDTIVVFSSDHGEMMGSHGIKPHTKQVPWDESARVPFLLRYPKGQGGQGRVVATPLTTPDVMPTLLSLAGVTVPKTVEGEDISSVVRGREMPEHDALYMAVSPFTAEKDWNKEYRAIRTDRYTYVRGLEGPWLLFDDVNDPYQTNNLVGQPASAALGQELDKRLQARLKAVHDDFRPAAFYVEKFGFDVRPYGSVPYAPGSKVQTPK